MTLPQIRYVALLGQRDSMVNHHIPQESISKECLRDVGALPQNFEHFIYGYDYYYRILLTREKAGYDIYYIYDDSIQQFISHSGFDGKDNFVVFMFCDEDGSKVTFYKNEFKSISWNNVLFYGSEKLVSKLGVSPVAYSRNELYNYLYYYAIEHNMVDWANAPFCVLNNKQWYDTFHPFRPCFVNRNTINSILGNWWGYETTLSDEEQIALVAKASIETHQKKYSYDRQKMITDQILVFFNIELNQALSIGKISCPEDLYAPPLIIALPYTCKETIDMYDTTTGVTIFDDMSVAMKEVLKAEYTKNYVIEAKPKNPKLFMMMLNVVGNRRSAFFDTIGMLHSSMLFSPYLRLPCLGPSINASLSAVGYNRLLHTNPGKFRRKIRKTMLDIGKAITAKVIAPDTIKMLKRRASQIVAITDLPIEWVDVDGVPLCFSHDVCRIPETPIVSMLSLYMESHNFRYMIPKDIISKTLVIFGCDDKSFSEVQKSVVELQKVAGFKIEKCSTLDEVENAVKKYHPHLIIFDCHGGVDEATHETFLLIGNEKLTCSEVVKREISAPLMVLSACMTAVTYNLVESIANAFFQVGVLSVTTSYMPVYIDESTLLYNRILRLLMEAQDKPIHRNWLAFMSHVQRTSYLLQPMIDAKRKGKDVDSDYMGEVIKKETHSMFFKLRRQLYKNLPNSVIYKEVNAKVENVMPNYMMYSTLGRADLIKFQAFEEHLQEELVAKGAM